MRKYIPPSEEIPKFYGVAWYQFEKNVAVCYPLPLNWIFGFLRIVSIFLKHGPAPFLFRIEGSTRYHVLRLALEVIATNGEGRGMGWTPAQHARIALSVVTDPELSTKEKFYDL